MNVTDCQSISDDEQKSQAGFTLVEVVVALAILALSLAVLLNVISNGMRQIDSTRKLAQAGALAQLLLAKLGTEMRIQEGLSSGEFPEGFRWRVRAERYGNAEDQQDWPVAAYTVSVEVLWGDPSDERMVALNTLRLALKEPGR
jgi:general secretion pathway protein I